MLGSEEKIVKFYISPSSDINPKIEKDGLSLNINMNNNALDIELVKRVAECYQFKES